MAALRTIFVLLIPACGIDRARDDFYEHHVSHSGSTSASTGDESSNIGSTSTGSSDTGDETTIIESTAADESSTTGSTSGESSGESSSGAPPAICGNGVPEPGEECDDGNDDDRFDACTTSCARARIIFLTSELFQGDINTVDGADNMCQKAAGLAGLPEYMNYKAIISDSTTDAKDRLFDAPGPYRLVNGLQVARNFAALMNETLEHPVDTTELGTDPSQTAVWTGTQLGGVKVPGSKHCEDWTSSSPLELGTYGVPIVVDGDWLNVANPIVNPTYCNIEFALYCLEQE